MSIDPKTSAILNLIVAVLGALGGASAQLTTLFGAGTAQNIVTIAGIAVSIIGIVNSGLHGVSSAKPGPLV